MFNWLGQFIEFYKQQSLPPSYCNTAMNQNDFFSDPQWPSLDISAYLTQHNAEPDECIIDQEHHQTSKDRLAINELFQINFQVEQTYDQTSRALEKLIDMDIDTHNFMQSKEGINFYKESKQKDDKSMRQEGSKSGQSDNDDFSVNSQYKLRRRRNVGHQGHKKKTQHKYNILDKNTKRYLVQQINSNSVTISQLSKIYNISVNNLCRWKKSCDRKLGAGRKVTSLQLQKKIIEWIQFHLDNTQGLFLSRKVVQQKARELSNNSCFKASKGWLQRFAKRNRSLGLIELFEMKLKQQDDGDRFQFQVQQSMCLTNVKQSKCMQLKQEYLQ